MKNSKKNLGRRSFIKAAAASGLGAAILPVTFKRSMAQDEEKPVKPSTNVKDALEYPRTETSMPGKYPAKVVKVNSENCIAENKIDQEAVNKMLSMSMLSLTGAESVNDAWKQFVSPDEVVGLKINPVAGPTLTTSHELVKSVIQQLEDAGIPKENIVIWDRREFQLHEANFTEENYPGIKITGTEQKDKEGSFYDADGNLYGEKMIDKDWFYWADVEGEYDAYTIPYMVNGGKNSYFSKICTQEVDKIINMPILKNAGPSITLCLKNLGYGCVSNTGRLHNDLWSETSAEVCAFPPVRDKVVLNIVDGVKGCFDGGPSANPQFITEYKCLLVGSDAVAVDRIGYEIVLAKRIEEGLQEEDMPRMRAFMDMADDLGLGESNLDNINLEEIGI